MDDKYYIHVEDENKKLKQQLAKMNMRLLKLTDENKMLTNSFDIKERVYMNLLRDYKKLKETSGSAIREKHLKLHLDALVEQNEKLKGLLVEACGIQSCNCDLSGTVDFGICCGCKFLDKPEIKQLLGEGE